MNRRLFIGTVAGAGLGLALSGCESADDEPPAATVGADPLYQISLAEWSLHRTLFGPWMEDPDFEAFGRALATDPRSVLQGEVDHLDFPVIARQEFGIDAVEYVNTFFFDRATDRPYLTEMKDRAESEGVRSLLIMCDAEGALGDPDAAVRALAVENHHKWVEAAAFLGCHSIRVNAQSQGSYDEQQRLAAEGLRSLAEFADGHDVNVLVENHGGLSSNGEWLAGVMQMADHSRVGTLPDFGNFRISAAGEEPEEWYDRYQGVEELMPYAKAVSAKSHVFDDNGAEAQTDFERMMRIVLDHGYHGHVGIEYEGRELPEMEGIRLTKALLERVRQDLAASAA